MTDHDNSSRHTDPARSIWKTRAGIGLVAFLAIAGLLLIYEHRIHVFGGNGLLITLLAVCIGMHFQWPTLLTVAMFPVLIWMYVHLARQEERETATEFGTSCAEYMCRVPAYIPRLNRLGAV